jgi:hypothetical protein
MDADAPPEATPRFKVVRAKWSGSSILHAAVFSSEADNDYRAQTKPGA